MHGRPVSKPSLLWRVFLVNGCVLGAAVLLLVVTPLRIGSSIALGDALVLLAGLAAMLAANYLLLRRELAPLARLVRVMESVDPMRPGRRVEAGHGRDAEVAGLAQAFNAMLERLEAERRESAARALAAQEAERQRIARELHDQVGQTLSAAAIQVQRARDSDGDSEGGLDAAAEAIALTLEDVRRIGRELRPEALDDLGLRNALIALCRRLENQSGVRIERALGGRVPPLSAEQELVVYRVAQEALTNVIRHARASTAALELCAARGHAVLTVADDGRGVTLPELGAGTGIAGMRERAMLAGGTLAIDSVDGNGATVRLELPAALELV
jgi:two-component system, NarL family, sensor histidine kinase UhpB